MSQNLKFRRSMREIKHKINNFFPIRLKIRKEAFWCLVIFSVWFIWFLRYRAVEEDSYGAIVDEASSSSQTSEEDLANIKFIARGSILSASTHYALTLKTKGKFDEIPVLKGFVEENVDRQMFILTLGFHLRFNDSNNQCLNSRSLTFSNCDDIKHDHWVYQEDTRHIISTLTKECLAVQGPDLEVFLTICDDEDRDQRWLFGEKNETAYGRKVTKKVYSGPVISLPPIAK